MEIGKEEAIAVAQVRVMWLGLGQWQWEWSSVKDSTHISEIKLQDLVMDCMWGVGRGRTERGVKDELIFLVGAEWMRVLFF